MNTVKVQECKSRAWFTAWRRKRILLTSVLRSMINIFSMATPCTRFLAVPPRPSESPSAGSMVTGTLYGYRRGHVHFAVQEDQKADPVLLLELATPTSSLVKEMSSGLLRIALETERKSIPKKILEELVWTMYCNGRKTGYAVKREITDTDVHILKLVQSVSMGAGVLPVDEELEGELMYMRAKFERVIGSRDSEALYMMNPDHAGAPELSIFFLRI